MTPNWKKIAIILAVILMISMSVMGVLAYKQHVALREAAAGAAADTEAQKALQKQIDDRDEADATQREQAKVAEANVKTSADAVKVVTKYIKLPTGAPSQVAVVQKTDFTPAEQQKLPDSPSYVVETQNASIQVSQKLLACDSNMKSLITCAADLTDKTSQLGKEKDKSTHWEAVAKGGTKSHRFWKFAECAGLSGAGAAAGALTKDPKYAAIGAIAGATACHFL